MANSTAMQPELQFWSSSQFSSYVKCLGASIQSMKSKPHQLVPFLGVFILFLFLVAFPSHASSHQLYLSLNLCGLNAVIVQIRDNGDIAQAANWPLCHKRARRGHMLCSNQPINHTSVWSRGLFHCLPTAQCFCSSRALCSQMCLSSCTCHSGTPGNHSVGLLFDLFEAIGTRSTIHWTSCTIPWPACLTLCAGFATTHPHQTDCAPSQAKQGHEEGLLRQRHLYFAAC